MATPGEGGGGGRGGIRYEIEHLSRDVPRAAALIGHFEAREEAMPMPCPRIIGLPLRGGGGGEVLRHCSCALLEVPGLALPPGLWCL